MGASLVSGFTALGATAATIVSLALHSDATPLVVIFGYGAVAAIGHKIFSSDSGERQRKAYERAEVLSALRAQTISPEKADKLLHGLGAPRSAEPRAAPGCRRGAHRDPPIPTTIPTTIPTPEVGLPGLGSVSWPM